MLTDIDLKFKYDSIKNNKIFDSKNNDLNIIFLPNYVFSNESEIDSYIKWEDFIDYVEVKQIFSSISVKLKNNKKIIATERVKDFLLAKTIAIKFLKEEGIIKLLNREEIEKFGISRDWSFSNFNSY